MLTLYWNKPMANNSEIIEQRVRHPEVAYDHSDLNHRSVFVFLISLAVILFIVQLAIWSIFRYLGRDQYAGHQTTNPMMTSTEQLQEIGGDPAVSFPMPRLQPNPVADLNKFRVAEEEELNSYGWVNQKSGKIHIPIERAIDILGTSWPQQQQQPALAGHSLPPNASPQAGATQPMRPMVDDREGNYGW